jgi:hypothetical protein
MLNANATPHRRIVMWAILDGGLEFAQAGFDECRWPGTSARRFGY